MKICIITGKIKPEVCGISDYVNLLAKELTKKGHAVFIVEVSKSKDFKHISKNLPNAQFYSFQFAPYLYSEKGISGRSIMEFAESLRDKNVQFNFHEIWIGANKTAKFLDKIRGWLQKKEIKKILKRMSPDIITASNSAALYMLNKTGIKAELLYLYGNIPFFKIERNIQKNKLRVALFGSVYEGYPIDRVSSICKAISKIQRKNLEIIIIGLQRFNSEVKNFTKSFSKKNITFHKTGKLSAKSISEQLQLCDIGISTTPYDILGKSGATAAMLEHGLPILVNDDNDTPRDKITIDQRFQNQIFIVNVIYHK